MRIKLDRLLFLLGVSLLVIGVGISVAVVVMGLVNVVLRILS
jgi:hypothetical protein